MNNENIENTAKEIYKKENEKINIQILELVNMSAQDFYDEEVVIKILKTARDIARKRNERNDKGWNIMLNTFVK